MDPALYKGVFIKHCEGVDVDRIALVVDCTDNNFDIIEWCKAMSSTLNHEAVREDLLRHRHRCVSGDSIRANRLSEYANVSKVVLKHVTRTCHRSNRQKRQLCGRSHWLLRRCK